MLLILTAGTRLGGIKCALASKIHSSVIRASSFKTRKSAIASSAKFQHCV